MKYITLKIDWEIMIVGCFVSKKIKRLYFYLEKIQYRRIIISAHCEYWIFSVLSFDFCSDLIVQI